MTVSLKDLRDQVLVLTGATSGIGLVTARVAADRGAKLMLVARNYGALSRLCEELREKGGVAEFYALDVAHAEDVEKMADYAIERFGRIDTWVNNAGVSVYGKLVDVPEKDSRRIFETNFWGVVNGSLTAARRLRARGGSIINIGSVVSDRAIPLQGMYSASKHAVKGFTDALRMEVEADGAPISVTLIKPSAIDTPYTEHAKNLLDVKPENPPPVYAPETVAEAILHCAENRVRDVFVGAGAKAMSMMGTFAPRITDLAMESTFIDAQKSDSPANDNPAEGLHSSNDESLAERGGYPGHVAESSLYTKASLHPATAGAAVAVGLGAAYMLARHLRAPQEPPPAKSDAAGAPSRNRDG